MREPHPELTGKPDAARYVGWIHRETDRCTWA
jgi:hypothetical protein